MHSDIPQLPQMPLLGNLHLVRINQMAQSWLKLSQRYGPVFEFKRPNASDRLIVVGDHKIVAELLDETRFQKKQHKVLENLRPLGGDGLFTAHNHEISWGIAHRILMPAFGPVAIRSMFEPMQDIADQMLMRWERFGPDAVIDVSDDMTRLTLDTIALCACNIRLNSFYQEHLHPFVDAMVCALEEAGLRTHLPGPVQTLRFHKDREFKKNIALMRATANEIIAARRSLPEHQWPNDLLSRMITGQDPETHQGLSDENIRYQLITFLIAGHETTSGMLSFAIHNLLQHPHVLAKARDLVDRIVGSDRITVHHLQHLGYIDQILKESLRLWPTAPAFAVHPYETTTLANMYTVRPEDALVVFTPILHRDPTAWDQPHLFQPERFDPDHIESIPDSAYKPFGNGQRACIGRAFAMQEAVLVLAGILQRFDLQYDDPNYKLIVQETLTLKPKNLNIRVRKRAKRPPSNTSTPTATHSSAKPAQHQTTTTQLESCTVLFGSDTGTSESFARQLTQEARKRGADVSFGTLNDAVDQLPKHGLVCIITASYLGEPTRDAKLFVEWLGSLQDQDLSGLQFAVFGCGDTHWKETYQSVPKHIDALLEQAGAQRLVPRGEGDASHDIVADFDQWLDLLWKTLGSHPTAPSKHHTDLTVRVVQPHHDHNTRHQGYAQARVLQNRTLTNTPLPHGSPKQHLLLELPGSMPFRAGDYLSIQPTNPPTLVQRALAHFALQPNDLLALNDPTNATHLPQDAAVSAHNLLTHYVELHTPATTAHIQQLALLTPCPPERKALETLLQNSANTASVLDLLERHPSCSLPLSSFLSMLPPLRPRTYSISSSPRVHPQQCSLTVSVVQGPHNSGHGEYQGVASSFLARLKPNDTLPVCVRPSPEPFHLPKDTTTPIILIAAGSGIAPMRAFLQERAALAFNNTPLGPALLYFGCNSEEDYLYKDELEAWQRDGIVSCFPAFSHDPTSPQQFVQDLMRTQRDWVPLVQQGARLYVCGSKPMANGIREMLREVLPNAGEVMKRYAEDVFS